MPTPEAPTPTAPTPEAPTPEASKPRASKPDASTPGAPTRAKTSGPIDPERACPIAPVVDIVFSRWTTPILWALNEYGRQRFVELERSISSITPKVLTQRLRQLERDGLVVRTYHTEVPPRVEYEISELGRSLAPLFASLSQWATANLDKVDRARRDYDSRPAR